MKGRGKKEMHEELKGPFQWGGGRLVEMKGGMLRMKIRMIKVDERGEE